MVQRLALRLGQVFAGFGDEIIESDFRQAVGDVLGEATAGGGDPFPGLYGETGGADRVEAEAFDSGDGAAPELMVTETAIGIVGHCAALMASIALSSMRANSGRMPMRGVSR
jgi:hypothetical protein